MSLRIPQLLLCLAVGAAIGAIVGALPFTVVGFRPVGGEITYSFSPSSILFAGFVLLFTLPISIVLGLPSYALLARWSLLNGWSAGAVGLAAAVAVAACLKPGFPALKEIAYFGAIGVSSSLGAFFFALRLRPQAKKDAA